MIYLKFVINKKDPNVTATTIETKQYSIAPDGDSVRVYYDGGQWQRVGEKDWLNCFVMSESGSTIDTINSRKRA